MIYKIDLLYRLDINHVKLIKNVGVTQLVLNRNAPTVQVLKIAAITGLVVLNFSMLNFLRDHPHCGDNFPRVPEGGGLRYQRSNCRATD